MRVTRRHMIRNEHIRWSRKVAKISVMKAKLLGKAFQEELLGKAVGESRWGDVNGGNGDTVCF